MQVFFPVFPLETIRYLHTAYANVSPRATTIRYHLFVCISIPLSRRRFHGSRYISTCAFLTVHKLAPFRITRCVHQGASSSFSPFRYFPLKSKRNDPHAWVEAAKALLPPSSVLNSLEERSLGTDKLASPTILLAFLTYARRFHGVDVLSQLGAHHGQWTGVLWMARRILQLSYTSPNEPSHLEHLQMPARGASLDELTTFAIWIDASHQRTVESMLPSDFPSDAWIPLDARRVHKLVMGEVWRSLGSMILEAADDSARKSKDIMPHVLQIIAHLHHINALPSKIYSYTSAVEGATLYRPPTLHFLSSRILTSLSDAVWRAHESLVAAEAAAVGARYTYLGHEVPGARYKVKVRELGPEVWMELVLWACVECGLMKEGASILQDIKMRSVSGSRWSAIPWATVQAAPSSKDSHTPKLDWERVKARADSSVAGVEGYSLDPPLVELGSRTISTEVVMAMIDGLLNGLSVPDPKDGWSSRQILGMMFDLHELLSRDGQSLDTNTIERMISRIVDYLRPELRLDSDIMNWIIKIATMSGSPSDSSPNAAKGSSESLSPETSHRSEAIINVLYSLLHMYAEVGDVRRANLVLQQLETTHDRAEPSTTRSVDGQDEKPKDNIDLERTRNINTAQLSPIRPAALASYIDLVVQLGELKSGAKLLYSSCNSKQLVSKDIYLDNSLLPALFGFAGATSDKTLLAKLEKRMSPPLSGETLRAYIHCQVQLRRWDIVVLLLGVFRGDATASWDAELAFRLTSFIMSQERVRTHEGSEESTEDVLDKEVKIAKRILIELLRGDYGPPEVERILSGRAQENYIECIGRMIREALEGFDSIWVPSKISWQYLRATENIPVRAFNVLLQAVVTKQGSLAGARMWEIWCQDIKSGLGRDGHDTFVGKMAGLNWDTIVDDEPVYDFSSGLKRATWSQRLAAAGISTSQCRPPHMALVAPNLTTLRIIMRRALGERSSMGRSRIWRSQFWRLFLPASKNSQKNRSFALDRTSKVDRARLSALIAWGREMYRAFGYNETEIKQELPGIRKRRRTTPVR